MLKAQISFAFVTRIISFSIFRHPPSWYRPFRKAPTAPLLSSIFNNSESYSFNTLDKFNCVCRSIVCFNKCNYFLKLWLLGLLDKRWSSLIYLAELSLSKEKRTCCYLYILGHSRLLCCPNFDQRTRYSGSTLLSLCYSTMLVTNLHQIDGSGIREYVEVFRTDAVRFCKTINCPFCKTF